MSLERIDRYLSQLEAVNCYERVASERDSLTQDNEALRRRLEELHQTRVTIEGKTLIEAEQAILDREESEIERRTQDRVKSLRENWEKEEKPKEITAQALQELSGIIKGISHKGFHFSTNEVKESGLDKEIEKILDDEVKRRMDQEFEKKVEGISEGRSLEKLEMLKSTIWPQFLEPKIASLEADIRKNVIASLNERSWTVQCDKCGTPENWNLTGKMISGLFQNGEIYLICSNPNCSGHKVTVTLRSLIEDYLTAQRP